MGPLAMLLSIWGCGQTTSPGPDVCVDMLGEALSNDACAEVQGTVVDAMGRALAGVTIRVEHDEGRPISLAFQLTHTDSLGHFESTTPFSVNASRRGFRLRVGL